MVVVDNERAKYFLPKKYRKQLIRDSILQGSCKKFDDAYACQVVSRADSVLPIDDIIECSLKHTPA